MSHHPTDRRFVRQALVAAIGLALVSGSVHAATFQVTNTADSGAGSFRQAIEDANAAAGADTIDFSPIAGSTITLAANLPIIVDDLTLQGSNVTLDGAGQYTCLAAESTSLNIDAMTITQCVGQFRSSSFNNDINYIEHSGGGIWLEAGDLVLSNTTVSNNAAPEDTTGEQFTLDGGGVFVSQAGNVSITNAIIQGNTADEGAGGIHIDAQNIMIADSLITGNVSTGQGGAQLSAVEGDVVLNSITVSNNLGVTGAGGLGVDTLNGDIVLNNVEILNNESDEGDGGLFARAYGADDASGSVFITDSVISNNTANGASESSRAGGGSLRSDYDGVEITDTTISGNIGRSWSFGGLTVSAYLGTSIERSAISGNDAEEGGGGLLSLGGLRLSDSMITDNSGAGGGLMHFDFSFGSSTASLEIVNSVLAGNSASSPGGGALIYNYDGNIVIESSTIAGNSADNGAGLAVTGALFDFTLSGSTISANEAGEMGGGLWLQGGRGHAIALTNSTISGNTGASGAGVAISLEDDSSAAAAQIRLDAVTITGNDAMTGPGGGLSVALEYPAIVVVNGSIISGNSATGGGDDLDAMPEPANTTFEVDVSLIGVAPNGSGFNPDTVTSDLLGSDPQLGALADNGGPTQTHLPAMSSPALDIVTVGDGCDTDWIVDQRGAPRPGPVSGLCDAGSVERQGAPEIAVAPTIDFGDIPVDDAAPATNTSIENVGAEPLEITGFNGPNAPFTLDFSECSEVLPFVLMPGMGCNLSFGFLPAASGTFNQTVTVESNSDSGDNQIALSGRGIAPGLSFVALDFGSQPVGSATENAITLTNDGDADLLISGLVLLGDAAFELLGDACADPVVPGASCEATIRFTPIASAGFGATLAVTSNASEAPVDVAISGQGIIGELIITPSGGLDFGEVPVGETGEGEIALTNDGFAAIEVSNWNDLEAPFAFTGGSCPEPSFSLDPGEACTLILGFSPVDDGDYDQTLNFVIDDGSGIDSVAFGVSGRGVAPVVPIAPAPVPVPTLDRIGLFVGSGLLALLGLFGLRRRQADLEKSTL